jgi:hypothetical protein
MKRAVLGVAIMGLAAAVGGSVFERFLSPDRPADRVIMKYLELAKSGKASSMELADLGVLILEKGFPGDAIDYLEAALKLDKHNYEAAYRLGLVLQREGKDREAARYYKKTLKERPGYAQARFMLALAEERCGERQAAIYDYAKAYRYAPELANPLKNPLVYDSNLQTESMLRHYSEAVRTSTLKVTEIDPNAIRRMMEALPPPTPPPADAKGAAPVGSEEAKPQPAAAGTPAGAPQRGRPVPTPAEGGSGPVKLDVRPTSARPPRPEAGRRAQPPEATPPPPPPEPTPAPEDESAAPAQPPDAAQEAPAPPAEPGSEEPKPTPTPTR